jgi:hypothetical protein
VLQQCRERAHGGTADADEMNTTRGSHHQTSDNG